MKTMEDVNRQENITVVLSGYEKRREEGTIKKLMSGKDAKSTAAPREQSSFP